MKIIRYVLPPLFAVIIIFILALRIDKAQIINIYNNGNIFFLITSMFFFLSTIIFGVLRWQKMLEIINYKLNFLEIFKVFCANIPIAKIIPGYVGDLARTLYFKDKIPVSHNAGVVVAENLIDILFLALISLISAVHLKNLSIIILSSLIIITIFCGFFVARKINLNQNNKYSAKINNFLFVFKTVLRQPKNFLVVLLCTTGMWLLTLMSFQFIFLAFGSNVSFFHILSAQPIIILLGLVPITISGIGVRESAMLIFYKGLAPAEKIFTVGLTYSIYIAVLLPVFCLPFLIKQLAIIKNKKYE